MYWLERYNTMEIEDRDDQSKAQSKVELASDQQPFPKVDAVIAEQVNDEAINLSIINSTGEGETKTAINSETDLMVSAETIFVDHKQS